MSAPRPTDLRVRLLDALLLQPPVRRADLCDALDVSLPVLAREVSALRAAGLVVQSAEDPARRALGTRGRPPVYISLVARAAFAVGIEIGTRTTHVVVCDLNGAILAVRALAWFPVDPRMTAERVHELVVRTLQDAGITLGDVVGVGVTAAPALVGEHSAEPTFAAWDGIDPAAEITSRLGVPAGFERAAIAGAVAEQRSGAGVGKGTVMYVRLSAGCGVGFIVQGLPHRGARGLAGEVGHVAMTAGRRRCYCGRRGCLETLATSEAIIGLFAETYGERVTAPRMLELIRSGDGRARRLTADAGVLIGSALAPAVNLMNPDVCVIGGELSLAGEPLLAAIRRGIARSVAPAIADNLRVVTSASGRETEALGAAITQLLRAPRALALRLAESA